MKILMKYKLSGKSTRTIIWYKMSNDINDLLEKLDKTSILHHTNFSTWPTHEDMNYMAYLDIDYINQVYDRNKENLISPESREDVLKLIRYCIRDNNLNQLTT